MTKPKRRGRNVLKALDRLARKLAGVTRTEWGRLAPNDREFWRQRVTGGVLKLAPSAIDTDDEAFTEREQQGRA